MDWQVYATWSHHYVFSRNTCKKFNFLDFNSMLKGFFKTEYGFSKTIGLNMRTYSIFDLSQSSDLLFTVQLFLKYPVLKQKIQVFAGLTSFSIFVCMVMFPTTPKLSTRANKYEIIIQCSVAKLIFISISF